jgi:hypothetical protein
MNKILIYNGNVHEASTIGFNKRIFKISNAEISKGDFNYDEFCDTELKKILDKEYDAIYVTLNLSDIDYLSMEGLRIVHHIRLSQKLFNSRTPIVLLCQEKLEHILKLTSLGDILLTPGTFLSSDLTLKEEFPFNRLSDEQYKKYLTRTKIDSPDNYQSHHSIANEWALYRYASAIKKPTSQQGIHFFDELEAKLTKLTYLKTLHFKYHEILYQRQYFKDKDKHKENTYGITGIEGKKIGLIEDEYAKGWIEFYSCILEESNALLVPFTEFDKSLEKNTLIENIKTWFKVQIEKDCLCDLYIIDLRLHDDDFYEKNPEELSGFIISEYIKKLNPGIQILISTASDKFRNFEVFIKKGITNFSIKESPETNLSKIETGDRINVIQNEIRKGCLKAYLAKIYFEIQNIDSQSHFLKSTDENETEFKNRVFGKGGLLFDVFYFLNSDDPKMIYNSLLTCFIILEEYSSIYGVFDPGSWKIRDKSNKLESIYVTNSPKFKFQLKFGEYNDLMYEINSTLIGLDFFEIEKPVTLELRPKKATDMLRIALVLFYRNNISEAKIDRLFKLKFIRNNTAHFGNLKKGYHLKASEIEFIISDILKGIL